MRDLETVELARPELWEHRHYDAVFATLRRTEPVSWQAEPVTEWAPEGGPGFWAVTTHAGVREVSRASATFVSGYGTEPFDQPPEVVETAGMLNMDAPEHTRLRRIVSAAFTRRAIEQVHEHVACHATAVVDRLEAAGEFDAVAQVADTYPAGIVSDMLGIPDADRPELVRLTHEILGPVAAARQPANLTMIRYGSELAQRRRVDPRDDLVSTIVAAEVDGERLSDHEVGVFFALLLTAGIETTGTAIAHGLIALAEHAEQRTLWASDVDGHTVDAVEEVVRWASPVRRFRRTCIVDTELGGREIAAGDKVVLWYTSANRDETVFDNPGVFDIRRDPNPHLGFGGPGPHFCLGANLARSEIAAFFRELFARRRCVEVTGEVRYDVNDAFNVVLELPAELRASPAP